MSYLNRNILKNTAFIIAFSFFSSSSTFAHHSFPATYIMEQDQVQTIEGVMVQFLFRNPHSFVHVMVVDEETGSNQRWAIEWGGAAALSGEVDRTSLKPGDRVRITGNPGRNPGDFRLRMNRLEVLDGNFVWDGDFD